MLGMTEWCYLKRDCDTNLKQNNAAKNACSGRRGCRWRSTVSVNTSQGALVSALMAANRSKWAPNIMDTLLPACSAINENADEKHSLVIEISDGGAQPTREFGVR